MTAKRFKASEYYEVWDNDKFLLSFDQTVDLLNELNDENEQLKAINKYLIEILEHNGATVEIEHIKGDVE